MWRWGIRRSRSLSGPFACKGTGLKCSPQTRRERSALGRPNLGHAARRRNRGNLRVAHRKRICVKSVLVFQQACQIAQNFTIPVVLSRKTIGGDSSSSIGAFVIVNDQGWIVTAYHIVELLQKMQADAERV